ncbi:hypothetical protein [Salmonirosea aquatica]|uniref:DUF4595 domain-containing protein n=1 Tax=Salmonirosea aquatica TaxID=2654236 RepID=A0A7C9FWW4_9BACT|nr:hypothetical protein [Cytophagaceae bacterium SJW1-29]
MKLSSPSILVLVITMLGACTDHDIPNALDRWRVKSLTRILPENGGTANISTFGYDAQNRLFSVVSWQTPDSTAAVIGRTSYEYDDQNRLSMVRRSVDPFGSEEYKFAYNANGQLATLDYDAGFPDTYHMTFIYSGERLASSLRKFDFFSSLRFRSVLNYTFSGRNLSKVSSSQTIEKVIPFVSTDSATFTYDDKTNPFYGVHLVPAPVLPARPTFAQFSYTPITVVTTICLP